MRGRRRRRRRDRRGAALLAAGLTRRGGRGARAGRRARRHGAAARAPGRSRRALAPCGPDQSARARSAAAAASRSGGRRGRASVHRRPARLGATSAAPLDRAFALADRAMTPRRARTPQDRPAAEALPPHGAVGRGGRGGPRARRRAGRSRRSACTTSRAWTMPTTASSPAASAPTWRASRRAAGPPRRAGDGDRLVGRRAFGSRRDAGTAARPRGGRDRADGGAAARRRSASRRRLPPEAARGDRTASRPASTSTWCCTGRARPSGARTGSRASSARAAQPPGLLTCIDGTPFHFFELDQPGARRPRRPRPATRRRASPARSWPSISAHRALRGLSVPAVTAWRHDPLVAAPPGRWCRPGARRIRDRLQAPVGGPDLVCRRGRCRATQWGTVGGAWEEGERAAAEVARAARGRSTPLRACSAAPGRAGGGRP